VDLKRIAEDTAKMLRSYLTYQATDRLSAFAAIGTAILGWLFNKNLTDAKEVAKGMIEQQLQREITTLIDDRLETLKRTLRREQIINHTLIDYYLPNGTTPPREFHLLQKSPFHQDKSPRPQYRITPLLAAVQKNK